MPAYIIRWPDGDVSIVVAETETEALVHLDEIDSPDPTQLHRLTNCSLHFKPTGHGAQQHYVLSLVSEETADEVLAFFYPD